MAAGKVITGFSKPYVALYSANSGSPKYTGAIQLARGVDVSIEPDSSDSSSFYADNVAAETVGGQFTGGTVTLTVDGLKEDARQLIMGIGNTNTVNGVTVLDYDDSQAAPYVGIGFIVRYMEEGATTYGAVVITKAVFNVDGLEAATQEDEIDFQTQELEATLMRDDSSTHVWKRIAKDRATEKAAEDDVKALLGGSAVSTAEAKSSKAVAD